MPDINERVLEIVQGLQEKISEIHQKTSDTNTEIKLLNQRMGTIEDEVNNHHSVLYGDPQRGGEGGLITKTKDQDNKINGIGNRLDSFSRFFVLIWTGIFAIIQLAFAVIKNFLANKAT